MKADLHIHSCYSDGKFTPQEVIKIVLKKEIEIISITDHDSIKGAVIASELNNKNGVEIITGVELSADYNGREIHILGYFIDLSSPALQSHVDLIKKLRKNRIEQTLVKLREIGLKMNSDDLFERYIDSCSLGRPHIANEMLKNGYVGNLREAYDKYLGDNKPAFVKKENLDFRIIIDLIKKAKGLAVLAHPGKYLRRTGIDEIIKEGIDGIEIYHPSHKYADEEHFRKICTELGLAGTGGSDFHGFLELDYKNLGAYFVTDKHIKDLKKLKAK